MKKIVTLRKLLQAKCPWGATFPRRALSDNPNQVAKGEKGTWNTMCSLGSLDPKHSSLSNLDGFSMDKNPNHVFPSNLDPKHGSLSNQVVKSLEQLDWGYHLVPFPKEVVPNVSSLKKLSKDYMFFSSILSMEKNKGENLRKKIAP
jgi:hypothetical protein